MSTAAHSGLPHPPGLVGPLSATGGSSQVDVPDAAPVPAAHGRTKMETCYRRLSWLYLCCLAAHCAVGPLLFLGLSQNAPSIPLAAIEPAVADEDPLPSIAYSFNGYLGDYLAIPASLAAVFHPRNVYCVLLDPGISAAEAATLRRLIVRAVLQLPAPHCLDAACVEARVSVSRGEFSVTWGGISEALATLDALERLLDADGRWEFFVNLTPMDYPLASQDDIAALLANARGVSFAGTFEKGPERATGMFAARWHWLFHDPALLRRRDARATGRQTLLRLDGKVPGDVKDSPLLRVFQGEAYGIWDRAVCRRAVRSPLSRRIVALLSHGFAASEQLLLTILMNPPGRHAYCPSSLRMNEQGAGPMWRMNATAEEDIHETVSRMAGEGLLFARKFPRHCVHSDDHCQRAYAEEPYRIAVWIRLLRGEAMASANVVGTDQGRRHPSLRQVWRTAAAKKLQRLLPTCVSSSFHEHNGTTSCATGPCEASFSVPWLGGRRN